jgi:hypothetical protein
MKNNCANNTETGAGVKHFSQLAELKAKLKGSGGGRHRYGRFTRPQIEELKRALIPHLLSIARRLFPYGVLSRTGGYLVIPALDIQINLSTGDYFPFPSEPGRPIGDFISLYIDYSGLPFRSAIATLGRIAGGFSGIPENPPSSSKENDREKRRIVGAAFFGTNDDLIAPQMALSALPIRRKVLAYLDTQADHAERYPTVKEAHPEFFYADAFARLLQRWVKQPLERQEFFHIYPRNEGKNIAFLLRKVNL